MRQRVLISAAIGMTAGSQALAAPPGEAIWIEATIAGESLSVGAEHLIHLRLEVSEAWLASDAGIPRAFLQIAVPDSIELSGRKLTTFRELSRNEFLEEPLERLIDPGETSIGFTLLSEPSDGEVIAINVVVYVTSGEEGQSYFVRRRIELPIQPGITVRSAVQADVSNWGDNGSLQIGDKAVAYELPRADGGLVDLGDALGSSNVIVTTYRAYW